MACPAVSKFLLLHVYMVPMSLLSSPRTLRRPRRLSNDPPEDSTLRQSLNPPGSFESEEAAAVPAHGPESWHQQAPVGLIS
jgi:hypothetical protein